MNQQRQKHMVLNVWVSVNEKGTTVESGYDVEGRWHLKLRKAKGKFTLDEIIEAAKEWEEDYYAVIVKAMSDEEIQLRDGTHPIFTTGEVK